MEADSNVEIEVGGTLDGRYLLGKRIGQGGMGSVFRACQLALQRTVVIKVVRPDFAGCRQQTGRIRNEALAACRVRNPHCVAVIDCGVLPAGASYLVMEHVPGRPLGRILAEEPIPFARAVELFEQILCALAATHEAGVVHADVTSENFLVERLDGRDHVTMIDFGLARIAGMPAEDDLEDGEVTVSGTPEYMAPEVIRGEPPTFASDVYGAGVILYELLTGATPFGGGPAMTIMIRHVHDPVIPPSLCRPDREIPPALDAVVLRALDKRPEARFPDAATFACELRTAVGSSRGSLDVAKRWGNWLAPGAAVGDDDSVSTRRRLARGSDCSFVGTVERLRQLRCMIGEALMCGDITRIANGYLELANALGEHQAAAAACELQEGIDILTAGRGPSAVDVPQVAERLFVALAALHEQAGSEVLARRAAANADGCKTLTDASL